jgi:2,3-bisphosphoglycerate-independent phosphoglycerate mutase
MAAVRRTALIIRDGWGKNHSAALERWDATKQTPTPNSDRLLQHWPHGEISASGLDVGLPDGIMGNSEVGHQNIGAGRTVNQEIVRIDRAFESGELKNNGALGGLFAAVKRNHSKLHLLGLCSDGGVHSVLRHAIGLLRLAGQAAVPQVCIHALMDGRDTPSGSGMDYVDALERACGEVGVGEIATVMGRFWAMDRDSRWERVERAYRCLVGETAESAPSAREAIGRYYEHPAAENRSGDEFIPPTQIASAGGNFTGAIEDGDAVLFFNFRGDRPREITRAFIAKDFPHFHRRKRLELAYATMCDYEKGLCPTVIFPKPPPMANILAAYLSRLGLRQFRTAETEKYAHVTFFFNDYREEPFEGEERTLIASPRDVETYDMAPAMSAAAVCDAFTAALLSQKYDFCLVNFANTDMVGHTGNFAAAKKAVATVDGCLGKILSAADRSNSALIVTADHGNVEEMWDVTNGIPHTQHTTNPVELFLYGAGLEKLPIREGGCLGDIAPTLLQVMGLSQPEEMTGRSLILP